jgi:hypothetical protein
LGNLNNDVDINSAWETIRGNLKIWIKKSLGYYELKKDYSIISRTGASLYISCSSAVQWQMIVLAYHGSQCTKFHIVGWTWWFFTPFYLESCIWPDAISDSLSDAAACQRLRGAMSYRLRWCNFLVQGYHCWPWDKATIFLM